MLADVLQKVSWEQVIDGVTLYKLTLDSAAAQGEYVLNQNQSNRQRFNLFFCCGGMLTLQRKHGADIKISREEIVLLSNLSEIVSIVVQESPVGYCLVIDPEICSAFNNIYRILGNTTWSYEEIESFLQKNHGCLQIKHSNWKQSVFSILSSLPDTEQGSYCVLKAAELCYLCHIWQSVYDDTPQPSAMPDYLTERLICIGTYVENHLDEKLSIAQLCDQFNLSPTTLKNKFREFYGQPIHNWIQDRRIRRAAELMQSTNMTILQIAQSVGYESVSQFNVIFRRVYGTAPSRYKKMSNTRRK